MNLQERERLACVHIDKIATELKQLALQLHANPELSEQEFEAAKLSSEFLLKHGFKIRKPLEEVPQLPTAFIGKKNDGKFKIAFLSEYDALPVLGHACGHNLINMMSIGAAIGFATASSDLAETTILGCPAEETIGGKVLMSEAGMFRNYDAALIIHPGHVSEIGGSALATHPLEITFIGRAAHVASLTDKGINALAAGIDFYQQVMQEKFEEFALIGGIFTEAGIAPNIIPDRATLRLTLRSKSVEFLEEIIIPRVKELAQATAHLHGTKLEMHHYEPLFKDLSQDETLCELFKEVMFEMGEKPRILPDDEADGSTDVGNVSHDVPTCHPTLAIGTNFEAHTPEFAAAAASDYALEQSIKGAKIMAIVALRYIMAK